jgi:hypothetical protein
VVFDGIGGSVVARHKGKYKFLDEVYFSPEARANVLSCSYARDCGMKHGHDDVRMNITSGQEKITSIFPEKEECGYTAKHNKP